MKDRSYQHPENMCLSFWGFLYHPPVFTKNILWRIPFGDRTLQWNMNSRHGKAPPTHAFQHCVFFVLPAGSNKDNFSWGIPLPKEKLICSSKYTFTCQSSLYYIYIYIYVHCTHIYIYNRDIYVHICVPTYITLQCIALPCLALPCLALHHSHSLRDSCFCVLPPLIFHEYSHVFTNYLVFTQV